MTGSGKLGNLPFQIGDGEFEIKGRVGHGRKSAMKGRLPLSGSPREYF
jgi:hypothetical protein